MKINSKKKVIIIGGGATGVIVALNILQKWGKKFEVNIVESNILLGSGQAYKEQSEKNILNVAAERMSAFNDDPNDFVTWLSQQNKNQQTVLTWPYLPRQTYGDYLRFRLGSFGKDNFLHIQDRALKVQERAGFFEVELQGGDSVTGELLILATGYVDSTPEISSAVSKKSGVKSLVVLGSGLSAIDFWQQHRDDENIKITFLSRHGLIPLPAKKHAPLSFAFEWLEHKTPRECLSYLRDLNLKGTEWQSLADEVRPQVAKIWKSWSQKQRSQFMRLLKTYWEVIRHRIPEVIYQDLLGDLRDAKLEVKKARVLDIKKVNEKFQIIYKDKNTDCSITDNYDFFLRATGYQINQSLIKVGDITGLTICPHSLGYQCNSNSKVWVAGPASKCSAWEITAVPEIRIQAHAISSELDG